MAVRRTRMKLESGESHPTRDNIVQAAADLMKRNGVMGLHIDDVLESTGLTRGAVYHHFQNVDDLREHAVLATYSEGVDANIRFIRNVLATAKTFEDFRSGVLQANLLYSENNRLREVRKLRAYALAIAGENGGLAEGLEKEQQRLTDEYVNVITAAQEKGWVRSVIEPRALAVFIQAYSFGVIVDDISGDHLSSDSWRRVIESFFENSVFDNQ